MANPINIYVTTQDQIRAVNNLTPGNPMRDNLSLGKPAGHGTIPLFDMSECVPNLGLQNVLIPFFRFPKLYNDTPTGAQEDETYLTIDQHDGLGKQTLASTIHHTFGAKFQDFLTKPVVATIGEHNFFQSLEDKVTATISGEIIIGAMLTTLEKITVSKITNIRELDSASAESFRMAAGKIGKDKLSLIDQWRASKSSNGIDLDPKEHTGGVGKFFEKTVGFSPMSCTVRSMMERPDPTGQCNIIYHDNRLQILPRTDWPSAQYKIGALGNPDGLGYGRKPLWWCNHPLIPAGSLPSYATTNWISPVTCYICETFLYETGTCPAAIMGGDEPKPCDNNMQCEHLFPFLEAQLFWSLKMPGIINVHDHPTLDEREYAPVCSKCNGGTHKIGLPILKLVPDSNWRGCGRGSASSGFTEKIGMDMGSIARIARDSPDYISNAFGRMHRSEPAPANGPQYNTHILTRDQRHQRCLNVFQPLVEAVNGEFANVDARRMCEILILRYFYYFDEKNIK